MIDLGLPSHQGTNLQIYRNTLIFKFKPSDQKILISSKKVFSSVSIKFVVKIKCVVDNISGDLAENVQV